ncbi:unnamed protein product [Brachionus calyciflorus]|uniref:Uncharacterized protein n=1 Tax=Brachionus calyciflorus TaxID=104777 RepID=A0A814A6D8_9BILA|nr:unnamed protein product [Brachionus calyciflorus]
MNKITLFLIILLNIFTLNECSLEYPLVREFKNSKLAFKSDESLTLEINDKDVRFFMIADQGGMDKPPYYTNILSYVSKLMARLALEHTVNSPKQPRGLKS